MLSDLFKNENGDQVNVNYTCANNKISGPPKRNSTKLCGIINQGATCYLNTLIQTLFFTKEFRDGLFNLSSNELGLNSGKRRVILIELQRLFGELLFLDQNACSTQRLTDSFGWSNSEELQQHDVQELNRILFNAIEQSLVNTKQSNLIKDLYRGTVINKIKCLTCLNVFQREEEFLDLSITVQGFDGLFSSLFNNFVLREKLDGNNQYRCEKCNDQYRDAEKYCQFKQLPPILTFSLLRFTYDSKTWQRIKETGKFEFPLDLDLDEFMEDSYKSQIDVEYSKYELFSVIIHSGSAYGGHYRTYIKDFDNLGEWKLENDKENEKKVEVKVSTNEICLIYVDEADEASFTDENSELVNLDFLKYDTPLELLKAFIYNKHKYNRIKIESACADLTKFTGMSWNKRFKNKYGQIEKFLRKNDDIFEISDNIYVKLKESLTVNLVASSQFSTQKHEIIDNQSTTDQNSDEQENNSSKKLEEIIEKHSWFDFNDSHITPLLKTNISKQFEGKESAYMLFYRRKSSLQLQKPRTTLPEWLLNEINKANLEINLKRTEHEKKITNMLVDVYLNTDFYLDINVLNMHQQFETKQITLTVNRSSSKVEDLKELLVNHCMDESSQTDQLRKESVLNMMFDETPFYWFHCIKSNDNLSFHIKEILEKDSQKISDIITSKSNNSLLILSKFSNNWPIGEEYEPIKIEVKFYDKQFQVTCFSYTFAKCTLMKQVKEIISNDYLANQKDNSLLKLTLIKNGKDVKKEDSDQLLTVNEDLKSIGELNISNKDSIIIEPIPSNAEITTKSETRPNLSSLVKESLNNCDQSLLVNMLNLTIMNCFNSEFYEEKDRIMKVSISDKEVIKNIKIMAISSFKISEDNENFHLRFVENTEDNKETFINSLKNVGELYALPGFCLYDDSKLAEVLEAYTIKQSNETNLTLLLSPNRAPLKVSNEITLKCCIEDSSSSFVNTDKFIEAIITLNTTRVSDLTDRFVQKYNLPIIEETSTDQYFLKTLNWVGDADSILNDSNLLCLDAHLKHNDLLVICKGKLIPRDHCKINIWQHGSQDILHQFKQLTTGENTNEVILNDFITKKNQDFVPKGEITVKIDTKLEDLALKIKDLFGFNELDDDNLRLRMMKKNDNNLKEFILKKCIFDWNKPIKQLNFKQENDICVKEISGENFSNQGIILINCIKFNTETKKCLINSFKEIAWNVNNGATLTSLKNSLLKAYDSDLEPSDIFRMTIAKRINEKHKWILLKEINNSNSEDTKSKNGKSSSSQNKKNKKKTNPNQSNQKSNLRLSPFNIDDGDLIAFTTDNPDINDQITADDFMSTIDIEYAKKSQAEIERLRKDRSKKKSSNSESMAEKNNTRRPEVGISIKIDDFN